MLNTVYLQRSLNEYKDIYHVDFYLMDSEDTLVYTTSPDHPAPHPNNLKAVLPDHKLYFLEGIYLYWIPLLQNQISIGKLIVRASFCDRLPEICQSVRIALISLIQMASDSGISFGIAPSRQHTLIEAVLAASPQQQTILELMNQMEMTPTLLRSVICIHVSFKTNEYFNINLNLGYTSSINRVRADILEIVRKNRYLTSQDLCAYHRDDELILIKSFLATTQISRTYLALDRILESLSEDLMDVNLLDAKLAYGNLYPDIMDQKKSYQQALDIIQLGRNRLPDRHIYQIEHLFTDSMCQRLPDQIIHKFFIPLSESLLHSYSHTYVGMLEGFEAFMDHCMNLSEAAKELDIHRNTLNNRILKLQEISGFAITDNFQDALLMKLFIVYMKNQNGGFL